MAKELKFEIIENIATLSENDKGWKKQLNIVKWGDNEPKYDIRSWNEDNTKMGKGVTLTKEELTEILKVEL